MATIATVGVSVTAKTFEFDRRLSESEKRLKGFSQGVAQLAARTRLLSKASQDSLARDVFALGKAAGVIAQVGKAAFTTTSVAAAGAATAVGLLTRKQMEAIDAQAKFADLIGVDTKALAGLEHGARITGVGIEQLRTGLQRMTRRVAEAAQGTGEAKNAIAELGLDARNLASQSPDHAFAMIADAMEGVTNQGDRVRIAMKLFDSEGVSLLRTMKGGSEAIAGYTAEADKLGIAVSRIDAAKVEEANDSITRMGEVLKGVGNTLAVEVSPLVTEAAERFKDWATEGDGVARLAGNLRGVGSALESVVNGLREIRGIGNSISGVINKALGIATYLPSQGAKMIQSGAFGKHRIDPGALGTVAGLSDAYFAQGGHDFRQAGGNFDSAKSSGRIEKAMREIDEQATVRATRMSGGWRGGGQSIAEAVQEGVARGTSEGIASVAHFTAGGNAVTAGGPSNIAHAVAHGAEKGIASAVSSSAKVHSAVAGGPMTGASAVVPSGLPSGPSFRNVFEQRAAAMLTPLRNSLTGRMAADPIGIGGSTAASRISDYMKNGGFNDPNHPYMGPDGKLISPANAEKNTAWILSGRTKYGNPDHFAQSMMRDAGVKMGRNFSYDKDDALARIMERTNQILEDIRSNGTTYGPARFA